ncbi:MAG: hypothetical protein C0183_12395 [Roseiflexus castenholzii]|nr:MAG: hypothetical protein C0183_12395 [Roseiflexus castenholzii]
MWSKAPPRLDTPFSPGGRIKAAAITARHREGRGARGEARGERGENKAAAITARHRLRGSDAIYVAVVQRFGAVLVTLEAEQRFSAAAIVPVRIPEDAYTNAQSFVQY